MTQGKRDALAVFAAQIGLLAAAVLSQSLLAWLLEPDGRGSYAVCATLAIVMPSLFGLAIDRATQVGVMGSEISSRVAIAVALRVSVVSGISGAVFLGLLLVALPRLRDQADTVSFLLCILLMPLSQAFSFQLRIHTALRRFSDYAWVSLTQAIVNVVLIAFFLLVIDLEANGAILALLASYAIATTMGFIRLPRSAGKSPTVPWPRLRSFGARAFPGAVGHVIDLNLGALVLAVVASKEEIGLFAAASSLILRFLMVPQSLQEAVFPRVAADPSGRPELVSQMARLAFAATVLALGVFLLASRPLVAILLSTKFLPIVPILAVMSVGIALHAISTVLMPYFDGTGRPGVVSWSIWAAILVNVAFIFLLYPAIGFVAAAYAFSAGFFVRLLLLVFAFCRATALPVSAVLMPRRTDFELVYVAARSAARRMSGRG